ncbi:MAG TPA: 2Fe-2S iron-sulfur cluster-binding protein [Ignavibacteria bacterium]|nr:2Fe-2S iron-sulfur cluster-binding protein [Ignavibacteria bacterium]HMR42116.1 2Fe-2S iron-sulfur cluster-binding protein [Ignavibacteria bacterium]
MPKITIDSREVEFTHGQTIIQAALNAGIEIPHFCYHPAMSVAGNCRICLVEIEKMPKLAIACATPATEGMIVHTKSEKTIHAQNAVMEFLLINHPLDCPICDEAGECKLQDYAYQYSVGLSRFDELKNEKDKRVSLGPNVMFDQERCISCSRCIRFCDEIAKSPQLTFVQRGDHVTIETFPGEELDNPYSMNVIEICPVGALTSKEFRFKSRVWEMSFTDTICPGCSRGCNSIMGVRNNKILRIEPRENPAVNDYWLCDWGRLNTTAFVNDEELRIKSPQIKLNEASSENEELIDVNWDEAISKTVSHLKNYNGSEIMFVASAFSTLEDNYALKKFAKEIFSSDNIFYIPNIDENFSDDLLRRSDKTPCANGLKLLGIKPYSKEVTDALSSGKIRMLYILNDDIFRMPGAEEYVKNIETNIHQISIHNKYSENANIVLPTSTYAEINGTFVNYQNRLQRLRPAVATLEEERIIGEFSMSRLDKFGAQNDRWTHGTKFNSRPGWKILKLVAKAMGKEFLFENSEEVFIELCSSVPELNGYDYETIGSKGIIAGEKPLVEAD